MNNLENFPEICLKHYTSRFLCPWNPYTHDYLPTYMEVLRDRPINKILEIGLGPAGLFHAKQLHACGLRMWAETFPEAEIFGLDYNPETLLNEGRIHSKLCDQSKTSELLAATDWVGGEIDFIVDDASHKSADQFRSILIFLPLLSPTGVYVVEDVIPPGELSAMLTSAAVVHEERHLERGMTGQIPDDRLIIIERKNNR